jgi:hypothetical protein
LKSPMSGTLISMTAMAVLEEGAPRVGDDLGEECGEARAEGADRPRGDRTRATAASSGAARTACRPTRLHARLGDAEDRDLGGAFTIGVNAVPPMPARATRSRTCRPACRRGRACPRAPWRRGSELSWRSPVTPFWSAFLITGTTRPLGVSAAKPMFQ